MIECSRCGRRYPEISDSDPGNRLGPWLCAACEYDDKAKEHEERARSYRETAAELRRVDAARR